MSTAEISKNFWGDQPFQIKAREAFPLLVRQAMIGKTIFYSDLAQELEMPNPRNLNYVLGSIGTTLTELSNDEFSIPVPAIQCLVVNKKTGLPGEGLLLPDNFVKLSSRQRKMRVDKMLTDIYSFSNWARVLELLQLNKPSFLPLPKISRMGSGGEGEQHKALKEYVAKNPVLLKLPETCPTGNLEYPLQSGDSVDVMFEWRDQFVAVEVKSKISSVLDIRRGLFQCVKYQAVTEAMLGVQGLPQNVRAVLVLEERFPVELVSIKNMLGVEVISVKILE